jgi:hypothetical protein
MDAPQFNGAPQECSGDEGTYDDRIDNREFVPTFIPNRRIIARDQTPEIPMEPDLSMPWLGDWTDLVVHLTPDQIKALPSFPATIVPAPGPDQQLVVTFPEGQIHIDVIPVKKETP